MTDSFKDSAPWLYYTGKSEGAATSLLLKTVNDAGYDVKLAMETPENKGENLHLKFTLAQYHLDGTFLGYTELNSQLFMCPVSYASVQAMRRFGTQTVSSCQFSLSDLKHGAAS